MVGNKDPRYALVKCNQNLRNVKRSELKGHYWIG